MDGYGDKATRTEVDGDGEAKWYENGGESIDLSSLFARLEGGILGEAFGGPPREEAPVLSVTKYGAYLPFAYPTDTYEPVQISRYLRTRRWIRGAVCTARLRLGEWVAGVKLQDEEDW